MRHAAGHRRDLRARNLPRTVRERDRIADQRSGRAHGSPNHRKVQTHNIRISLYRGSEIRIERGQPSFMRFDPPIEGRGEWLNTAIYRFTPARLAPSTTYRLTIPKGLTSAADGVSCRNANH